MENLKLPIALVAAKLMADIAAVYVIGASGIAAAYFGFNAMESKNASSSDRSSS